MAHGQPDFAAQTAKVTVASLSDMAELAVRLGSIDTFDRRGDVVWFDDFEGTIEKWQVVTTGTGAAVVISAERARNGGFSAKLTTGDAIGNKAELLHWSPYPVVSKIGIEVSFTLDDDLDYFTAGHILRDGDYSHIGGLRYVPDTDKLQYWDENGTWQDLATSLSLYATTYIFHTLKLVIDLDTQKYVRCILDETEYDMSAISYQYYAVSDIPYWEHNIAAVTAIANNVSIYVDDAIVTQNEP